MRVCVCCVVSFVCVSCCVVRVCVCQFVFVFVSKHVHTSSHVMFLVYPWTIANPLGQLLGHCPKNKLLFLTAAAWPFLLRNTVFCISAPGIIYQRNEIVSHAFSWADESEENASRCLVMPPCRDCCLCTFCPLPVCLWLEKKIPEQ